MTGPNLRSQILPTVDTHKTAKTNDEPKKNMDIDDLEDLFNLHGNDKGITSLSNMAKVALLISPATSSITSTSDPEQHKALGRAAY
ncbi:hypothetical protein SVAN01_11702 [Stagonosporopsis vannaccii]|nr:hypothetical protein SVAN01_11702 [Stagonosporopsis vannaccii]